MKKVTIMIPTYNQPQYIEQCVDSALAQDYPNLEVIISDDSTNDNTETIVKEKYLSDSRVKYFHNIPALGRVSNYHKTLYERATGDYVLNLDGDDWLIDYTYLSKAATILNNNENVACVTANKLVYNEEENTYTKVYSFNNTLNPIMKGSDYLYEYAMGKVSFSHMTTLYRRKKAMTIGFYVKNIIFSDGESFFRLFCQYDLAFINQNVGVWRKHSNNESKKNFLDIDLKSFFSLEESIENECKEKIFGNMSALEWATKLKLNNFYATISSNIKVLDIGYVCRMFLSLWKYDKYLFLQFFPHALKNIFTTIRSKI